MATEFWSAAQVIFGPFVFSFQFLVLVSLEYWQNGLYKLCNEVIQQIWSEKVSFDSVLTKSEIQEGRHENPRWRLSDVTWRHTWGMIVAIDLSHLISGVSFMSISFIVFKKWRWGRTFDAAPPPPPVQGRPKKPSLNRVKFIAVFMVYVSQKLALQKNWLPTIVSVTIHIAYMFFYKNKCGEMKCEVTFYREKSQVTHDLLVQLLRQLL